MCAGEFLPRPEGGIRAAPDDPSGGPAPVWANETVLLAQLRTDKAQYTLQTPPPPPLRQTAALEVIAVDSVSPFASVAT